MGCYWHLIEIKITFLKVIYNNHKLFNRFSTQNKKVNSENS